MYFLGKYLVVESFEDKLIAYLAVGLVILFIFMGLLGLVVAIFDKTPKYKEKFRSILFFSSTAFGLYLILFLSVVFGFYVGRQSCWVFGVIDGIFVMIAAVSLLPTVFHAILDKRSYWLQALLGSIAGIFITTICTI